MVPCNSLKIPRERSRIGSNPITRTKNGTPKGCRFSCGIRGFENSFKSVRGGGEARSPKEQKLYPPTTLPSGVKGLLAPKK